MSSLLLEQLYHKLIAHLDTDPERKPLGGLGVFHCFQPQSLREIPILQPFLILVIKGQKRMVVNQQEYCIAAGEFVLFPENSVVLMENHPVEKQQVFLSIGLSFSLEVVQQFHQTYTDQKEHWDLSARWKAPAPENIIQALSQWFEFCQHNAVDVMVAQHRHVEFLLLLAQAGMVGHLIQEDRPSWKQKVTEVLAADLAYAWKIRHVCRQLAMSESSLRRRLQQENTSFRCILEDIRLTSALGLLQETYWPISRIADSVGYQSQARFSERFKQRFGISPSALRKTRLLKAKN